MSLPIQFGVSHQDMAAHAGHNVVVLAYPDGETNLECEDCYQVILNTYPDGHEALGE